MIVGGFAYSFYAEPRYTKENNIIQLGYPPIRIDLLTTLTGVTFETAWENKIQGRYGKVKVYFISIEDLIQNKKVTGRNQDIIDLKYLENIKTKI